MAADMCAVCGQLVSAGDAQELVLRSRSTGEEWPALLVHLRCITAHPNVLAERINERLRTPPSTPRST